MGEATLDKGTISVSTPKLVFGKVLPDRRRLKKANRNGHTLQDALFTNGTVKRAKRAPSRPRTTRPRACRLFSLRTAIIAKWLGQSRSTAPSIVFTLETPATFHGYRTPRFNWW